MGYLENILSKRKLKIGLRAGHSPNCLGAIGLRNEHYTMKTYYQYVKECFEYYGHTVIDCNSNASSERAEVYEGINKANANNVDIFISLHMNSLNGQAYGVECLVASGSRVWNIAENICKEYAKLGFFNRGVKVGNQWEMRDLNAPNIIFETCFCDSEKDINIWSPCPYEKLVRALCHAVDPSITLQKEPDYYRVVVQRFTSLEDAQKAENKIKNDLGLYCFSEKI